MAHLGNTREYRTPVELPLTGVTALAGASNHALYDAHGTVYAYGPPGVVYRHLASGSAPSYAISTTGNVYPWGVGHVGQVGDWHTRAAVTAVIVAAGAASISAAANNVVISVPRATGKP